MLLDLYAGSLEDARTREHSLPLAALEAQAIEYLPIDAKAALAPAATVKILAEIKRASPSKGSLAEISDPVALARVYEQAGASAISVLTEGRKFKGSLQDLRDVRKAVNLPLLRKDFIASEYQILEARAAGADIVLLIVAGLEPAALSRLKSFTEELGLLAFLETHSADEVKTAVDLGAEMIGVNARDLTTFETDRNLFAELVHLIPASTIKVAESAVRDSSDVRRYREAGADVVLVGEALVVGDASKLMAAFLES